MEQPQPVGTDHRAFDVRPYFEPERILNAAIEIRARRDRHAARDRIDSRERAAPLGRPGAEQDDSAVARADRGLEVGLDRFRERRAISHEHERRNGERRRVDPRDAIRVVVHGEQAIADLQQRGARGHAEQHVLFDHTRRERRVLDRANPRGYGRLRARAALGLDGDVPHRVAIRLEAEPRRRGNRDLAVASRPACSYRYAGTGP